MALCLEQDAALFSFGVLKDFLEKFGLVVDRFV